MTGNQINQNWRKINESLELLTQLSQLFGAYHKKEVPELLLRKLEVLEANLENIKKFLQTRLTKFNEKYEGKN